MEEEHIRRKFTLKPWHGVILFLFVLAILLFGSEYLYRRFGILSVAMLEIAMAVLGLLPLLLFDVRPKDMLPVKRPGACHLGGMILMWMGTFLFALLSMKITTYFFSKSTVQITGSIGDVMTSVPELTGFLIFCIMPAICEEILHRGFLLTSMRSIKSDWVIVLIMALMFGVFHTDPARFVPTAILGAGLSYIMVKTKNILLPSLMHLIHNSAALIAAFATRGATQSMGLSGSLYTQTVQSTPTHASTIGFYLIFCAIAPLLVFAGARLLTLRDRRSEETAGPGTPARPILIPFLITLGIGVSMFVAGLDILIFTLGLNSGT
jgi:uncharacterized protein